MKTDDLIRTLSADQGWRAPPVVNGLWLGLALALPISIAIFAVELGLRPDFRQALFSPFFDLKFVITAALAIPAFATVLQLARPGAAPTRRWLFLAPLIFLFAGIAVDLAVQTSPWRSRLVGSNALVCLTFIPLLSAPVLAAALMALRYGASVRPALSGAVAGLLAGGMGATLYAAHCVDDSPLFVAVWYSLGIALVALVGALAGRRLLRF